MTSLKDKKAPSLVLSGGGVKAAAFHVGVCLALKECGFRFAGGSPKEVEKNFPEDRMTFKNYVGTSAGAVVATTLAAGFDISDLIESFLRGKISKKFNATLKKKENSKKKIKPISYRHLFSINLEAGKPSKLFSDLFKKGPVIHGGLEVLLKKGFKVNGVFTTKNLEKIHSKVYRHRK